MRPPDPGHVLRLALLGWGLGHVALGRPALGYSLLAAEVAAALLVGWLTIGLADSSAYLVPFLAGIGFLVVWAWQAIGAYRSARVLHPPMTDGPERSPAVAMVWLSLPLLAWSAGFWLVGASAATPAATLDRFVTDWSRGSLVDDADAWPPAVLAAVAEADVTLGDDPDRLRDVRVRLVVQTDAAALAVAEAVHYERRESSFLGVFAGSELVPVSDELVLSLELAAVPVELPGGGEIGAVRWALVDAEAP